MASEEIDINKVRAETPGIKHGAHLLACGSALTSSPVLNAVTDYLRLESEVGGYEAAQDQAQMLDGVYDSVAKLIGAQANEIALMENATAAWCMAFYSTPFEAGDRILTCEAEYGANYVAFLQRAKRDGVVIDVIPSGTDGAIDVEALESMIDERVKMIAITWIPTNGGLINPAKEVGAIARQHGITYLLDACQAVGQMPVDVAELGCDFLSATGRKFLRGPRGTGFLFVKADRLESMEPVMIDHFSAEWVEPDRYRLRTDARRFENWENAYALRAGLGVAVDYALDIGLETIQERAFGLAAYLRGRLAELPGTEVQDLGSRQCAIVTWTTEGLDPQATVAKLRDQGVTIGASGPNSTLLDSRRRNLPIMFRAAPHYFNTEDEIDRLTTLLSEEI